MFSDMTLFTQQILFCTTHTVLWYPVQILFCDQTFEVRGIICRASLNCINDDCVTSGHWYWLGASGSKTPLTSAAISTNVVGNTNRMLVDGGKKCLILWNYSGTQFNDWNCPDMTFATTVCQFDGSSLSPTSN